MKIKELLIKIDVLKKEERALILEKLIKNFSEISKYELLDFQNNWNGEKNDFNEFVKEQNKKIKFCLEMEMSFLGTDIRKIQRLKKLTLESKI